MGPSPIGRRLRAAPDEGSPPQRLSWNGLPSSGAARHPLPVGGQFYEKWVSAFLDRRFPHIRPVTCFTTGTTPNLRWCSRRERNRLLNRNSQRCSRVFSVHSNFQSSSPPSRSYPWRPRPNASFGSKLSSWFPENKNDI